jgi:predicted ABC-type ATPase
MANVYIVGGPNGAGKTTFAQQFLPIYADCETFINADLIAADMLPLSPDTAAFPAVRLMLEQIALRAKHHEDFGFETTLSGHGHLNLIRELKREGYKEIFFFVWLPTVEMSLSRVHDRVLRGGHNIPKDVVRRRFGRSIQNFFHDYGPLADSWTLFNNSGMAPRLMAFEQGGELRIIDGDGYHSLIAGYGKP